MFPESKKQFNNPDLISEKQKLIGEFKEIEEKMKNVSDEKERISLLERKRDILRKMVELKERGEKKIGMPIQEIQQLIEEAKKSRDDALKKYENTKPINSALFKIFSEWDKKLHNLEEALKRAPRESNQKQTETKDADKEKEDKLLEILQKAIEFRSVLIRSHGPGKPSPGQTPEEQELLKDAFEGIKNNVMYAKNLDVYDRIKNLGKILSSFLGDKTVQVGSLKGVIKLQEGIKEEIENLLELKSPFNVKEMEKGIIDTFTSGANEDYPYYYCRQCKKNLQHSLGCDHPNTEKIKKYAEDNPDYWRIIKRE